jgi:hypothetical protein
VRQSFRLIAAAGGLAAGSMLAWSVWGSSDAGNGPRNVQLVKYGGGGGPGKVRSPHGRPVTDPLIPFSISGSIGGLYPGDTSPMQLTVNDRERYAITVTSVSTVVRDGGRRCSSSYLHVSAWSGRLAVAAQGTAHLSVLVTLTHSAPDACQGAVFPFGYSGIARRSS